MAQSPVKKAEVSTPDELPPEIVEAAAEAVAVSEPELDAFGKLMKASADRRHNLIRERVVPPSETLLQGTEGAEKAEDKVPHHELDEKLEQAIKDEFDARITRGETLHARAPQGDPKWEPGTVERKRDDGREIIESYHQHPLRHYALYPIAVGLLVIPAVAGISISAPFLIAAFGTGVVATWVYKYFKKRTAIKHASVET